MTAQNSSNIWNCRHVTKTLWKHTQKMAINVLKKAFTYLRDWSLRNLSNRTFNFGQKTYRNKWYEMDLLMGRSASLKKSYQFMFFKVKGSIKRFRVLSFAMIIFPVFQTAFSLRLKFDINIEIVSNNCLLKVKGRSLVLNLSAFRR